MERVFLSFCGAGDIALLNKIVSKVHLEYLGKRHFSLFQKGQMTLKGNYNHFPEPIFGLSKKIISLRLLKTDQNV